MTLDKDDVKVSITIIPLKMSLFYLIYFIIFIHLFIVIPINFSRYFFSQLHKFLTYYLI